MTNKKRILYIVNHGAFFVSHRLPLALGARAEGFEIGLVTGQAGSDVMEAQADAELARDDVRHWRCAFRSAGLNPFREIFGLLQMLYYSWRMQPDIIHCASPKAVLYGGITARLCSVPALVLAISGMGYAFTATHSEDVLRKYVRHIYGFLVRWVYGHKNIQVIVQNHDDYKALIDMGLGVERITLIPGSGVDLKRFSYTRDKAPVIVFPARLLKDKGVEEFVQAARLVREKLPHWRFLLAGAAHYDNPTAITVCEVETWVAEGVVEWLGHVEDMAPLLAEAAIVCLPSYREGMPKALLEAAAAGCAVVTTDVTGCREAIIPGQSGDLVPPRNAEALADALLALMTDAERRAAYGRAGRALAEEKFTIESVVAQTMAIYKGLLNHA